MCHILCGWAFILQPFHLSAKNCPCFKYQRVFHISWVGVEKWTECADWNLWPRPSHLREAHQRGIGEVAWILVHHHLVGLLVNLLVHHHLTHHYADHAFTSERMTSKGGQRSLLWGEVAWIFGQMCWERDIKCRKIARNVAEYDIGE